MKLFKTFPIIVFQGVLLVCMAGGLRAGDAEEVLSEEFLEAEEIDNEEEILSDEAGEEECALELDELPAKDPLKVTFGNIEAKFQLKYRPETFFAVNANMLNKNAPDYIYFSRSTADFNITLGYGREFYGENVVTVFGTMRNKVIWGNPRSIRTTPAAINTLGVVDGFHNHFIGLNMWWIREFYLNMIYSSILGLDCSNEHSFTLGAFPFEVGRGISLGSAYAVNPGILGFYSDNTIDQYAYGFKFSGDLFPSLQYDVYGAILRNETDSFAATAEVIRGQEFGRERNPERGSGRVNFVVASRLQWYPVKSETASASFEPYLVYNSDPAQRVEFMADASSQLCTIGLAGEYVIGDFEWGFDGAKNFGHQKVRGWDRNVIVAENRNGVYTIVNKEIYTAVDDGGQHVVYVPGSVAQKTIEKATARDASQNNKCVGAINSATSQCIQVINPADPTGPTIQMFNSTTRFRDAYKNTFKGWMATGDAAYWLFDRQLRVAAAFGYATGDESPNVDLNNPNDSKVDSDYKGFIPLQEIYSGDRVQSVFFLGGAGRVPRPLSLPSRTVSDTVPTNVSGFTNLIFTGASMYWVPSAVVHDFGLRPNVLFYWQQHATKAFDLDTKSVSPDKYARNYLGMEINTFMEVALLRDFKLYFVVSAFVPGSHFKDIKGQPLSKEQQKVLERLDRAGLEDVLPFVSDDMAYTFNIGLEYRF